MCYTLSYCLTLELCVFPRSLPILASILSLLLRPNPQSSANISENKVMRQCAQSERVNTPMASGNGKEIISTQAKASVDICGRAVSVVEGQNAPQHQRHEEPRFIQVGEKVSFCTIVEAVLIPSVEDIPQGEKHQRW